MVFPKIPGMEPVRRTIKTTGTHVTIGVKAPDCMETPEQELSLTNEQFSRYLQWLAGGVNIQEAFPELSPSEREVILSGLPDDFFEQFEEKS